MYQPNDLYKKYLERYVDKQFSSALPDVTKKITLEHMNYAINLCEFWNSCLDVGCGNGHYLAGLSSKFKKCVGIELDHFSEQKELMDRYTNIEILNKPVEEFDSSVPFDFILLSDIFEHIPKIEYFVKKISSIQTIGGIVYLLTPNPVYCGPASESLIYHVQTSYHGHIKHYNLQEVVNIMKREGYEMEFNVYEETEKRQRLKNIAKGFSRRDKAWSSLIAYRIVRPLALILLKPIFWLLGKVAYNIEYKNSHDQFTTRTLALAFKKSY